MSEEKWVEYGAEQGDISEEYDNHMLFHTEQLADWSACIRRHQSQVAQGCSGSSVHAASLPHVRFGLEA